MKVRRMTESDRAEFISMGMVFYASDAVLFNINEAFHEEAFEELMRSNEYLEGYMLEHEGVSAGYALLNRSYSREAGGIVIWLEELYIREEYRGKGFGGAFLDWMCENVPAARYRLETEPDNVRAAALYKKHGFEPLAYAQMVKVVKK